MKKRLFSALVCIAMVFQTGISSFAIQNDNSINVTFDDLENNLSVLSTTFNSNGTDITSAWPGGSPIAIITDSGFVADNPSGNKYIQFTYASGSKPGEMTIVPTSPLTKDFAIEFKYALNNTWPASGYWPINNMMLGLEFYMQKSLTSNYLSRAFNMAEDGTICVPGFNGSTQSTSGTGTSSNSERISTYSGGTHFDTVKVVTRFNADNGYPLCDVYVKNYGSSEFVLKREGIPFSKTTKDGKTQILTSDYNQGIGKIGFNLPAVGSANNQVAFDDIKIYTLETAEIPAFDGEISFDENNMYDSFVRSKQDKVSEQSITYSDGTQFAVGATYKSAVSVSGNGIVTNNGENNKYIQFSYTGEQGTDPGMVKITPVEPLNKDFVFEFDFAIKNTGVGDGGTDATGSVYWPGNHEILNLQIMPDVENHSETAYTTKAIMVDQLGRIKTPKTSNNGNYTYPNVGSSGSDTRATHNSTQFATVRMVTRFIENDYPVYDVYVKLPGETDFGHAATNLHFSSTTYSNNYEIPASDYNDRGIRYLRLNASKGNTTTSDHNFDVAFDNIRIYEYVTPPKFTGTIDFEDKSVSSLNRAYKSNKSATIVYEDGTTIESVASVGEIAITDNGFVKNNVDGNKYLQISYKGSDNSANTADLEFNFAETFKEDFTVQFKYAVDSNFPIPSTEINEKKYWDSYSFILSAVPDLSLAARSSRLFFVLGKDNYADGGKSASTAYAAGNDLGVKNVSMGDFETIKIETKFHDNAVPTYDIYRKIEGKERWECLAKNQSYSTQNNSGTAISSNDYNTKGIKTISLRFFADSTYKVLTDEHYMNIAIDDIEFYKTKTDKIDFKKVNVKDSSDSDITSETLISGKTLYPDVSVANYFDTVKNITVLMVTYNDSGMMTGIRIRQIPLKENTTTNINSDNFEGITVTQEGYVKLYIVDDMDGLNSLTERFSSER